MRAAEQLGSFQLEGAQFLLTQMPGWSAVLQNSVTQTCGSSLSTTTQFLSDEGLRWSLKCAAW